MVTVSLATGFATDMMTAVTTVMSPQIQTNVQHVNQTTSNAQAGSAFQETGLATVITTVET